MLDTIDRADSQRKWSGIHKRMRLSCGSLANSAVLNLKGLSVTGEKGCFFFYLQIRSLSFCANTKLELLSDTFVRHFDALAPVWECGSSWTPMSLSCWRGTAEFVFMQIRQWGAILVLVFGVKFGANCKKQLSCAGKNMGGRKFHVSGLLLLLLAFFIWCWLKPISKRHFNAIKAELNSYE